MKRLEGLKIEGIVGRKDELPVLLAQWAHKSGGRKGNKRAETSDFLMVVKKGIVGLRIRTSEKVVRQRCTVFPSRVAFQASQALLGVPADLLCVPQCPRLDLFAAGFLPRSHPRITHPSSQTSSTTHRTSTSGERCSFSSTASRGNLLLRNKFVHYQGVHMRGGGSVLRICRKASWGNGVGARSLILSV